MTRPLLRLTIAVALLTAACSLGAPASNGPTITIEIEVPAEIDWRRTIAGVEVAGSGTQPDREELAMLDAMATDGN